MHPSIVAAAVAALLTTTIPVSVAGAAEPAGTCSAPKPKKKGIGLGGLLSAARRAGVGNMLGDGMLGSGKGGQILGAVGGTVMNAAEGGRPDAAGLLGTVAGQDRAGQIAGAVAGTALQMAQNGKGEKPACPSS